MNMSYADTETRHYPLREQMAVCDANYIRLLKLLPAVSPSGWEGAENARQKTLYAEEINRQVVIPGAENALPMRVNFSIVERFRYTTEVSVVQQLPHARGHYSSPCMQVRMYHDAGTAEVISYQHHRQYYKAPPMQGNTDWQGVTLERTQLNIFLAEWLVLCTNKGLASDTELKRLMLSGYSGTDNN